MNIVEIRTQIEEINSKYDDEILKLKMKIGELECKKLEELGELNEKYDKCVNDIIDQVKSDTYVKQPGVTVKKLKNIVINSDNVPNKYKMLVVNDKKIKADLKESDYTIKIPGVEVSTKYSVAVSLKK